MRNTMLKFRQNAIFFLAFAAAGGSLVCLAEAKPPYSIANAWCTQRPCMTKSYCSTHDDECPNLGYDSPCNGYWQDGRNEYVCDYNPAYPECLVTQPELLCFIRKPC